MDHPEGAGSQWADRMDFDPRVWLEFRGTQLSSDGGLLVMRTGSGDLHVRRHDTWVMSVGIRHRFSLQQPSAHRREARLQISSQQDTEISLGSGPHTLRYSPRFQ
ncbi:hypothetical protein LY39_03395 [Roseinatronobacter bogoriensis subsp. barguzinensis]|uniref:Uncharacterized protein n=1 Tax=Roseinatronobacter bogoriensis subsp. barguzinensis TaxID=441209 RepID=A0A2K8K8G1_9RHOB|nr:hypothetical protein BG454_04780 [Rhodobaca barguzinensis]MBB4209326.1 hypothetical protein [Rhodobaca bogoriensis DSM 18756]TDW34340.1 hypothetical protein LY39_03395 [Rhodobaca barguzinensis]TDY67069.1 hypothetical protein EV660_10870 [Rhodobaca bogoriensis DSM 18756]